MNEDYIDKLVGDIQQYLREEEKEEQQALQGLPEAESAVSKQMLRHPLMVSIIMLLSACAVGSITVAILLLGFVSAPARNPVDTIWLLAIGGGGIFFSTMLLSVWKRLTLLGQIEKNTRLILESKQKANLLLEHYISRID